MSPRSSKLSIWVLAGLLTASTTAGAVAFHYGRRFFEELNAVRLDPLGLTIYPDKSEPPPSPGQRRVVFFGDSRSAMWTSPTGHPEMQFINRGIAYQTTAQVLGRFDADVAPLHPDVIVLEVGVNDLKTIPLFPARRAPIVEAVKANTARIVAASRAIHARVVLTTVFPLGRVPLLRRPFWSDEVATSIVEVNQFLETLASADVTLLQSSEVLVHGGELEPAFSLDLFHLTPAGYDALNEKALLPLLSKAR